MNDETRVSDELSRRAEDVHGAMIMLDEVRGRARSIRRRRRGAIAGGVAAAVALVVIVPTVLTGGSGPKSNAPDPAPQPEVGLTSVLHDGTLTLPDGETVELDVDNSDVAQLGVLTDGRIVLAMNEPYAVRVYDADGTLQDEYEVEMNMITMSADHDAVAWTADDDTSRVLASGEAEPVEMAGAPSSGGSPGIIDAVLDPGTLLVGDGNTTGYMVTAAGRQELTTSEPFGVTDVSPDGGLWAVQYPDDADPQFGCVGLYDPAATEMVARNCETSQLHFAPDGQHLLGMRGDNGMWGDATIFDLDLQQVGGWVSEGRGDVIQRAAWADSEHVLVAETNWKTNTWALTRVDLAWADREVLDGPAEGPNPEQVVYYLLSE